jgi:hypothetical protein
MPILVPVLALALSLALAGCGARAETAAGSRLNTLPVLDRPDCWPLPKKVRYEEPHVVSTDEFVPGPFGGRRRIVVIQVDALPTEVSEQTRAGLDAAGFEEQTGNPPKSDSRVSWFRKEDYGWLSFTVAPLPEGGAGTPFRSTVTANIPGSTWSREDWEQGRAQDRHRCPRPVPSMSPSADSETPS